MPSADESTAREKTLLSRRKVIGTALWAAPAITLATAAPALAASGDTLTFGTSTGTWSGNLLLLSLAPVLTMNIPITLGTKHGSSATNLSVTVTFNSQPTVNLTPAAPTGWTVSPTTAGKGPFVFTHSAAVPAPASLTLSPTFTAPLGAYLSYPMTAHASEGLIATANSTVTTPPPAGFTDTGTTSGNSSVTGVANNTN